MLSLAPSGARVVVHFECHYRREMFMDTGVLNQKRLTALIWFWALALLKP